MNAYVTIDNKRIWLGDGLESLTLNKEWGFSAATLSGELDRGFVEDNLEILFDRVPGDRLPISAGFVLDDGSETFSGVIDDPSGTLTNPPQRRDDNVAFSARSLLANLIDELPDGKNKLFGDYANRDWAAIVNDVVARANFDVRDIDHTGIEAGDPTASGGHIRTFTGELFGEVVEEAVEATGFVANVRPDGSFFYLSPEKFSRRDPKPISIGRGEHRWSLTYQSARVTRLLSERDGQRREPGDAVRVIVRSYGRLGDVLSRVYHVTKVTYAATFAGDLVTVSMELKEDLPRLGGAKGQERR